MQGRIHTPGFLREYHGRATKSNNYLRAKLAYYDFFIFVIREDNKEAFLRDLNLPVLRSRILESTESFFLFDAVNCATAVLNGEIGPALDYNAAFCFKGVPALHNAAAHASPKLAKLFLARNGDEANLRWDCEPINMKGMQLPLNAALEWIRRRNGIFDWDWNRSNSVFKLVFRLLCRGCLMRRGWETVRLLVQRTNEMDNEIYYYAKEGKVVELAALLMVARDKVMTTPLPVENNFSTGRAGATTIRPFVLAEIASLSVFDARSMYAHVSKKEVQELKTKKTKLEQILLLLKIFERVGEQLSKYLKLKKKNYCFEKLAEEVTWIFEEGGFDVKRDLFEDIQRKAPGIWCVQYLVQADNIDNWRAMPWNTSFNHVERSYRDFPTKKSYQQALSAARRSLLNGTVRAPLDKRYVPQLRSYHVSPIAKANMEFKPMTLAKKIKKVQNLKFHKLFLVAFTRALKWA